MKLTIALVLACSFGAQGPGRSRVFNGVVSDSMCKADHKAMAISPDARCVRECVARHGSKYVLMVGARAYLLSDQQTPAQFAAERVNVKGILYEKTGIIKVESISRTK